MKTRIALTAWLVLFSAATLRAQEPSRVVHVIVALADNDNQGIVPVSRTLGNGTDPARNLYWGAAFGVKSFFYRSRDWQLFENADPPSQTVLERAIFRHRDSGTMLVADAYRGDKIQEAIADFLAEAEGSRSFSFSFHHEGATVFDASPGADLLVYVGHNGLMDASLARMPANRTERKREVIILACASKPYFVDAIRASGATPLLWTTGLMAPEAYTLKAALDGWIRREDAQAIRLRAAAAYHQYQKCGLNAAKRLFATGW